MIKKIKIDENEVAAFRKAVEGTKPLIHKKIRITSHRTPPSSSRKHFENKKSFKLNETHEQIGVRGDEFIAYKHASISNKILRNLRKGQYNVDAILDLHGLSVEKAKIAVDNFLEQSLRAKIRVVLIIHGKGRHGSKPILKNKLNHWLRINVVLAFCSADPTHGSHGAMYVLLKRI